jgi:hypothetical protein
VGRDDDRILHVYGGGARNDDDRRQLTTRETCTFL